MDMALYASTFASGLQTPVKAVLSRCIPDARVIDLLDGIITYRTKTDYANIHKLRIFQNTFMIIKRFEGTPGGSVEQLMQNTLRNAGIRTAVSKAVGKRRCRYRIVTSQQNKLVAVDKNLLRNVQKVIEGSTSLWLDRAIPDIEFWFLSRREKLGFFMLRLTIHASAEKVLNKGELRPELCQILCSLSEPAESDVFLDPFCGYGSIPKARSVLPYGKIYASDIDPAKVSHVKQKAHKEHKAIQTKQMDALNMAAYDDASVDKIVTDPPWGIFNGLGVDIGVFYGKMLTEFSRVLRAGGTAVVLTARDGLDAPLSKTRCPMGLESKFDVLVSGKKASVYKIVKTLS
jgi:tRNA (guanine6-N2)-methyltransferase